MMLGSISSSPSRRDEHHAQLVQVPVSSVDHRDRQQRCIRGPFGHTQAPVLSPVSELEYKLDRIRTCERAIEWEHHSMADGPGNSCSVMLCCALLCSVVRRRPSEYAPSLSFREGGRGVVVVWSWSWSSELGHCHAALTVFGQCRLQRSIPLTLTGYPTSNNGSGSTSGTYGRASERSHGPLRLVSLSAETPLQGHFPREPPPELNFSHQNLSLRLAPAYINNFFLPQIVYFFLLYRYYTRRSETSQSRRSILEVTSVIFSEFTGGLYVACGQSASRSGFKLRSININTELTSSTSSRHPI